MSPIYYAHFFLSQWHPNQKYHHPFVLPQWPNLEIADSIYFTLVARVKKFKTSIILPTVQHETIVSVTMFMSIWSILNPIDWVRT